MERFKQFFSKVMRPDEASSFPSELYEKPKPDLIAPPNPPLPDAPVWRGQARGALEGSLAPFEGHLPPFGGHHPHRGDEALFGSMFEMMDRLMRMDDGIFGGFGGFKGPAQQPISPRDSMLDKDAPPLPPPGSQDATAHAPSPRDAFLRQDTDLDADPGVISREQPGFTDEQGQVLPRGGPADPTGPTVAPWGHQGGFGGFHGDFGGFGRLFGGFGQPFGQPGRWDAPSGFQSSSTSVSVVVKPDGSVEETRTVRDHTGREETTVTTREAGDADMSQFFEGQFGGFGSMFGPLLR